MNYIEKFHRKTLFQTDTTKKQGNQDINTPELPNNISKFSRKGESGCSGKKRDSMEIARSNQDREPVKTTLPRQKSELAKATSNQVNELGRKDQSGQEIEPFKIARSSQEKKSFRAMYYDKQYEGTIMANESKKILSDREDKII